MLAKFIHLLQCLENIISVLKVFLESNIKIKQYNNMLNKDANTLSFLGVIITNKGKMKLYRGVIHCITYLLCSN